MAEFAAGYALGGVLRGGEEEFEQRYGSVLGPHRILAHDPGSPWRHIPWPGGPTAGS